MDLLSQYNKDHPEAFREQKRPPLTDEYGRTYTGMIAFVMRLSGGKIRDARRASYALLILVAVAVSVAFFLFAQNFNLLPTKKFSAEDAARQMEEYKKIQPF